MAVIDDETLSKVAANFNLPALEIATPPTKHAPDCLLWAFQQALERMRLYVCIVPAAINRQWFYVAWENARSILFLRGDKALCVVAFAPSHAEAPTGEDRSVDVPAWGPDCELGFEVRR